MEENEQRDYLQGLAVEADNHQRRAQDIQNQMQTLQMAEMEMEKTTEALKNLKGNQAAMFSLGSGMFISGELKSVDKVLVNVGANTMVEMNVEGALKFIEDRKKEISDAKEDLIKGMQALAARLKDIDNEARKIMGSRGPGSAGIGGA